MLVGMFFECVPFWADKVKGRVGMGVGWNLDGSGLGVSMDGDEGGRAGRAGRFPRGTYVG